MKNKITSLALVACIAFTLLTGLSAAVTGCQHLDEGADPLVVNAERLETTARGAFNFVTDVDAANRSFYATNAPAFHDFVEWLRTPMRVDGTNVIRRGPDMILALNDAKHAYKLNRSETNALAIAINALSTAVIQAQSWQNIIQTPTPK